MVREVRAALASYFEFYNACRPHQSLEDRTPDEVYFGIDEMKKAA
jgi:putative transposase